MKRSLRKRLAGGQFAVTVVRSRQMRTIKGRGNKTTEARLRAALVAAGIRGWEIAPPDVIGKPDFFFRKKGLAVFVDGCFWHGCQRCGHIPKTNRAFWRAKISSNKTRDKAVAIQLRKAKLKILRLWEHVVRQNLSDCVLRIIQRLK